MIKKKTTTPEIDPPVLRETHAAYGKKVTGKAKKGTKSTSKTSGEAGQNRTKLTPKQLEAIVFLSEIPSTFSSMEQLAKKVGVSRTTLYEWGKLPAFAAELTARVEANYKAYGALARSALVKAMLKGDIRAIELFYKHAEGWKPTSSVELGASDDLCDAIARADALLSQSKK